jgi:serine/threonine protein phosphatase PrpC
MDSNVNSLNTLWTSSTNFVKAKIAEGLTPQQKKVALIAVSYLVLVGIAFLIFQYYFSDSSNQGELKGRVKSQQDFSQDVQANQQHSLPSVSSKKTIQKKLEVNQKFALEQQNQEKEKKCQFTFDKVPDELTVSLSVQHFFRQGIKQKTVPLQSEKATLSNAKVGMASCQGKRDTMEDEHLAIEGEIQLGNSVHSYTLCGVFDGHGGSQASKFVKDNINNYQIQSIKHECQNGLTEEGIYRALKKTFKQLDADYNTGKDGTTATVVFIIDEKVWVANVGDSRTLLVYEDKVVQASEDAKPEIERYKKKIEKLGGNVFFNRVNGSLAVATAIGDKKITNDQDRCVISPSPKITCYALNAIQYITLACDGLFDVASTEFVGETVREIGTKEEPEMIAKRLVHMAINNISTDNVTAMVMKIPF